MAAAKGASAQKEVDKIRQNHVKVSARFEQASRDYFASQQKLDEATQGQIDLINNYLRSSTRTAPQATATPTRATAKTAIVRTAKAPTKTAPKAAKTEKATRGGPDSLTNRIIKVIGTKVMTKDQVYAALEARNLLPDSKDALKYVGYTLSATKTAFERDPVKGRGFYRVIQEGQTAEAATPKRRGPAPKKAAAAPTPAKKAASPTKKTATAKTTSTRATTGRAQVKNGERPKFKDAIIKVIGTKVMTKQQVHDALEAKGWLPASDDTLKYVGHMLSATKTADGKHNLFERDPEKGRGFYRNHPSALVATTETTTTAAAPAAPAAKRVVKKTPAAKIAKVKTSTTETNTQTNGVSHGQSSDLDQTLADAGMTDPAAPFGG